mgnify:CR=1 FL=1
MEEKKKSFLDVIKEAQNKKIKELVNELLDTVLCNPNCKNTLYDTTISADELPIKYLEK